MVFHIYRARLQWSVTELLDHSNKSIKEVDNHRKTLIGDQQIDYLEYRLLE